MPRVSVVIAAHNSASTIGAALDSLLTQTMLDWEAIIVDDGSTDETVRIVTRYATDARFRLLQNAENLGSGASRNRAIGQARADYIAVLDADDVCLPGRLERQLAAFEEDPELTVSATQIAEFGDWGGPVESGWPTDPAAIARRQERLGMPFPHCSSMFRKDAVLAVGGYDEKCLRCQDYALALRLGPVKIKTEPTVLLHYRTTRPLALSYAIRSGRYARFARTRALSPTSAERAKVPALPGSALLDLRSTVQWARRRWNERAAHR